jgi:hypothetical protein
MGRFIASVLLAGALVACHGGLAPVPSPADHVNDSVDAAPDPRAAREALCQRVCQIADQVMCEMIDCPGPCLVRLEDPYCQAQATAMFGCLARLQPSDYYCAGPHRMRSTPTCDPETRAWTSCVNAVGTRGAPDGGTD